MTSTVNGAQIREARERAGLTQQELATRLGVTLRTIGNWERGATVPKNRQAAIRAFLAPRDAPEPGLHSASDAELLAEIARRFARGREDYSHDTAPMNRAGGGPAVVDVSGRTDRVPHPGQGSAADSP